MYKLTKLKKLTSSQQKELCDLERSLFEKTMPYAYPVAGDWLESHDSKSPILLENNKVIGFYLITKGNLCSFLVREQIPFFFDDIYDWEGSTLGVSSKLQGLGLGKKLIEEARKIYGPLWGATMADNANLHNWLKIREYVGKYYTSNGLAFITRDTNV